MGSCSSVQREPAAATMGYRLRLVSKAKRFFASSPEKEKSLNEEDKNVSGLGVLQSHDFAGSKEEIFFDTRAWIESDCEDDFFSVNGDFTPSRGSTPVHQSNAALTTPRLDKTIFFEKFPDLKSEPSPTGRKKLLELFSESVRHAGDGDEPNAPEERVKSNNIMISLNETNVEGRTVRSSNGGTPNNSGGSSGAHSNRVTPSSDLGIRKEKSLKTGHCCLPNLHAFTFVDRRQKTSPARPCAA